MSDVLHVPWGLDSGGGDCWVLRQGVLPEDFFQLLVEVVKIEAMVTLRDAMNPTARVPLFHAPPPMPQPAAAEDFEADSDDDDQAEAGE